MRRQRVGVVAQAGEVAGCAPVWSGRRTNIEITVTRFQKFLYATVAVASIIILGIGLFRPFSSSEPQDPPVSLPAEQLEEFLADAMDYNIPFARILAEKRIVLAQRIGREHPALAVRSREVVDSLRARLERRAKITR